MLAKFQHIISQVSCRHKILLVIHNLYNEKTNGFNIFFLSIQVKFFFVKNWGVKEKSIPLFNKFSY